MLIDSHHHLWKYSAEQYGWINDQMSVLKNDFWSDELNTIASESGVDGFVSVQARQNLAETDALLSLAQDEPLIRGVVGWVPLADDDIESILDRYVANPWLKGFRHVVQDEPDDRFILGKAFNRGIGLLADRGLVYDVLIFAHQLPATIEFVDAHQELPMVLDHIAKPTIHAGRMDASWETNFRELSKRRNLTCKFSGVVTEVRDTEWTIDTLRPYWDVALEAFTPSRLMFGSDLARLPVTKRTSTVDGRGSGVGVRTLRRRTRRFICQYSDPIVRIVNSTKTRNSCERFRSAKSRR